jgi:hypothetical protein
MADTFTGFPAGGIAFLAGLAADNATTYFDANRDTSRMMSPHHREPLSPPSAGASATLGGPCDRRNRW